MKRALITGITGQDGSYLAEFLLEKGYEVYGIIRRSSSFNTSRIDHIFKDIHEKENRLHLVYGDLTDPTSIKKIIGDISPDEIYNLAAQSHVRVSFDIPEYTADANALGTLRILEAIKENGLSNKTRFYQASTSELFGKVTEVPQSEKTPFYPRSPYGIAKLFSYWTVVNYREGHGIHASNGILFNHESPRRGETFVTRKITRALGRIKFGLQKKFYLGNLDAERDWGYARDYVEAMWLMLQKDTPEDYVIGTGKKHSIRKFLEMAIESMGLGIKSNGLKGLDEKYINENGEVVVEIDKRYFRPTEVDELLCDPSKAKEGLGWVPRTELKELVDIMVKNDLNLAMKERLLKENGKHENLAIWSKSKIGSSEIVAPNSNNKELEMVKSAIEKTSNDLDFVKEKISGLVDREELTRMLRKVVAEENGSIEKNKNSFEENNPSSGREIYGKNKID